VRRARVPLFVGGAALILGATLSAVWTRPVPLQNTFPSPEAAAVAVIEAMRAGDVDRIRALALTEEEFRVHVWPYLPAARPERNVPFEFVWDLLQQNSEGHLRQTVHRLQDASVDVRAVRFAGETSRYGDVTVSREAELLVAGLDGTERVIRLFGSMVEQDGGYKVFSYVVDD
jgi:hypothetical protein